MGQQVYGLDVDEMLTSFRDAGGSELDTAYVYNDGACEREVGASLARIGVGGFSLATKVNPRVTGRLDHDAVIAQLEESLGRLGVTAVDVMYFHFPDRNTPIDEPIRAAAEMYAQGKFSELGVSNFPLSLVYQMLPLCDELGCPRPTVFEGVYNALSRHAENELMANLDDLGMRFYAYNPLAGGILSGRYHSLSDEPSDGRFALRAKSYKQRYWKPAYFEAIELIRAACGEEGVTMVDAAYRWLGYHSMLSESRGDGVIVGASKHGHLMQNIGALSAGPLPPSVLDALEEAWHITSADAPPYYRYFEETRGAF